MGSLYKFLLRAPEMSGPALCSIRCFFVSMGGFELGLWRLLRIEEVGAGT
jgi:hypothetical protein